MATTIDLPRHQVQLVDGIPTKGEDCAVRSGIFALDWATSGHLVPSVNAFRRRAGTPTGGLMFAALTDALRSFDKPEETDGYSRIRASRFFDPKHLAVALSRDRLVIVAINYGWLNDHHPRMSGDPRFRGNHAVPLLGLTRDRFTTDYDPLFDGRREGIPDGPRRVDVSVILEAAAHVNPAFRFMGVKVFKSSR